MLYTDPQRKLLARSVVTINSTLLFLLNTLIIVGIIFYWDTCVVPVTIYNSGFAVLACHVC